MIANKYLKTNMNEKDMKLITLKKNKNYWLFWIIATRHLFINIIRERERAKSILMLKLAKIN